MRWWIVFMFLLIPMPPSVQADQPQVDIVKMPAQVGTRYFDPKRPPRERPPLEGPEEAVCAGDFLSDASVGAQAMQTDATHAKGTVNRIKVTLQLNMTIWLPNNPQKWTVEHEEGHRQISEYYYQHAEPIARRVAESYLGKTFDISGRDLRRALSAAVGKISEEITNEYNRQMPIETTQARYDEITEHSRKDIPVPDAVAQALKETYPGQSWATPAMAPPSVTIPEPRAVPKF
ncbi:MAG: hypothetical protein Q8L74_01725 [Nitrospirota bacterium]|nr:hypothetical protein [Nitrospirota bacterium]MDP2383588.1 hypothetical protein [Nitrospirota bacterium]MDP3597651.1 hypothetical protein [Nitrospirota bacterium]